MHRSSSNSNHLLLRAPQRTELMQHLVRIPHPLVVMLLLALRKGISLRLLILLRHHHLHQERLPDPTMRYVEMVEVVTYHANSVD